MENSKINGIGDSPTQTVSNDDKVRNLYNVALNNFDVIPTDILKYNKKDIRVSDDLICITDIWRAEGRPGNKRVGDWLRYEVTKDSISRVCFEVHKPEYKLVKTKSYCGQYKAYAYTHYEIAKLYAWHLSIYAHAWFNDNVIPFYEKKKSDTIYQESIKSVSSRIERIERILSGDVEAKGLTAGQIWRKYNLPPIAGSATWFARNLIKRECHIEGKYQSRIGDIAVNLYDMDKVRREMDEDGLYVKCLRYVARRQKELNM